jgi:hypothetical protein
LDILHLIDRLEEMVRDARKLPVGGGAVISRQRLLDLIDRMRVSVPREIYDARDLIERQDEVLRTAHEDAEMLLAEARVQVEEKLKETAIVKAAEEKAREVAIDAQKRAQDLLRSAEEQARARLDDAYETSKAQMREADVYALQVLRKLEEDLEGFLSTARRGAETLEQRAAERPG